tara:strand:+ start:882 stop:1847 length:966 start_codon:yes stop_codon:yes gene_type:complete
MTVSQLKKNKLVIFFYKIYVFFLKKIKRFLSFPIHLGESDCYPASPFNVEGNQLSLDSLEKKIKFWSGACKKHKTLKYFYEENPHKLFVANSTIGVEHKYYKPLFDFYKDGVGVINSFYDESEFNLIEDFFKKKVDPQLENDSKGSWFSNNIELNKIIFNKLSPIERIIFDKKTNIQQYVLAAFKKNKNNKSAYKHSVKFHVDRYIPSIKLIYFHSDVKIDPFEYYLKSHIINNNFYENVKIFLKESPATIDAQLDSLKINNYLPKKFFVKKNSLVIAATHGLHRRSQTDDKLAEGVRRFITTNYYNEFTKIDLLKSLYLN